MGSAGLGTIVFSHGNSFPAGTYRVLFEAWQAAGFTVHALDKYGHDPHFPVSNQWPRLRDELIQFAQNHSQGPAFLVGHSLGGYLSLLAAAQCPALARGVVLLDSPLVGGWLGKTIYLAKATGMGGRISPGQVSKGRRQHWPSPEAARAHFAAKPAFARWDPQVLQDYIRSGIEPSTRPHLPGHTLRFSRDVETLIYNTLPHDIPGFLRQHPVACPVAFVGGSESLEVKRVGLKATQRVTQGRVSWIEGSHLFPFEQPEKTVHEVLRWLAAFAKPAHP
ncbi:MAG TPA: alpha/beta hydrolase [Rhizobacter sp.]|nr:alpha/beta hydrolase [Rhizobacter sp.]